MSLLALVVFSGLGLTANAAVPGDFLYGLDVAMEQVGIGAGSLPERISEGQVLAGRGQHSAAAEHLEASISSFGQQATAEDLMRAVEALDEYESIVGNDTPDGTPPPPPNENAGPDNNNAGGNSENAGPDNNNAGGNSENTGPDNNNTGGNSENTGPGNNNGGGNGTPDDTPPPPNENAGPGNNSGGGNGKGGN